MPPASIAVVLISLNEAHNMRAVLENIQGWATEIFLVDSYSSDATIDIALEFGVTVVQHEFKGFGDQWNFALKNLPITATWTMKLDPDERLSESLKINVQKALIKDEADGFKFERRLWFMGEVLPIRQKVLRLWKTGCCEFTSVLVNEHPIVAGKIEMVAGELQHHDSPNLHHWFDKQNRYSTAEAVASFRSQSQPVGEVLGGIKFEKKTWIKKNFSKIPFRFILVFLYNYIYLGSWKKGRVGYIWAMLRVNVYKSREYKLTEMILMNKEIEVLSHKIGTPDVRVPQY